MDPFARRALGRTGVEVTQLGLGTAPLGDLFEIVAEDRARETVAAAWAAGIRFFDTAPWYGRGQSEHRLGRALYRLPRAEYVLSTKVGRVLRAAPDAENFDRGFWRGGLPFPHRFDYSHGGVMRAFEDSQQRLGIPRIDLLLIHDLDRGHHGQADMAAHLRDLAGGARALAELRAAGVIRGFGAGINELGMIPRLLDVADLDFFLVAMPYTLLDQDVLDAEFPACEARGIAIVIGSPFASGILATGPVAGAKYRYAEPTPPVLEKTRRIEAVCGRHGVELAAAALQFPLGHPAVASVVPGAIGAEQVLRNVASMAAAVPAALWAELRREGLLREDAPVPEW